MDELDKKLEKIKETEYRLAFLSGAIQEMEERQKLLDEKWERVKDL